jgi:hypothetical protein
MVAGIAATWATILAECFCGRANLCGPRGSIRFEET